MTFSTMQPKDGDLILHCGHIDDPPFHFFRGLGKFASKRPDGSWFSCQDPWFVLCGKCLVDSMGDPSKTIRGEAIWNGNEPFVLKDTRND